MKIVNFELYFPLMNIQEGENGGRAMFLLRSACVACIRNGQCLKDKQLGSMQIVPLKQNNPRN